MSRGNRLNSLMKRLTRPGAHWEMLAITAVLFVLVAVFVDLKPVVDENFFFSTSDPGFGQSKKIEQRFPSQPEVILAVSSRDISSPRYLGRIQKLTQQINAIDEVSAVKSLAEGPKSFQDALASPFWSRLLIAEDRKSSNVLVFLENKDPEKPVKRIERIMHELDETDFRIHIAGPPYVVEMIRRSLAHDFWYFSLTAVVLFDGLRLAGIGQLVDWRGQAVTRPRIRRCARLNRRVWVRLRDVSAVFTLGDTAGKQNRGSRTASLVLVASLFNSVGGCDPC